MTLHQACTLVVLADSGKEPDGALPLMRALVMIMVDGPVGHRPKSANTDACACYRAREFFFPLMTQYL
jgi:hypothetical protein